MVIINIECAMKQEFLNPWNPNFWNSRGRDCDVTCAILPNKILSTHAPYPYICVTRDSNSEEPSRVHYAK